MGDLNYPHTCPKIDSTISDIEDTLFNAFKSSIEDLCPRMPDAAAVELAEEYTSEVAYGIMDALESVRESNTELREIAETQISNLESDVENFKEDLKEKEAEIATLEKENQLLQSKLDTCVESFEELN